MFLHVFGAIVWIGVGLTGHAVLAWADRAGEHLFATTFQRAIEWIEPPALVAGPLLLLGTGVGLVLDGPWRFGHTWILVGLSGYLAALALGGGFQMRLGRRYSAIVEERGPADPEALSIGRRLNALMWIELGILVVVLLAMTTKPMDGGTATFWAVVAVIIAGSASISFRGYQAAGRELHARPSVR